MKLTPNATDPSAVARAAEGAGADAVSLVNTLKGMALHPRTGEPWLGGRTGGVSGPAIRAIALEQVAAVSAAVDIPVIGMGGIASGRDAAEFMAAGAAVIAVGTESFRDPAAGRRSGGRAGRDWSYYGAKWSRISAMTHAFRRNDPANCGKAPAKTLETVRLGQPA